MQHLLPPSLPPHNQAHLPALYRLDAGQRAEFWASLALRHSPGLGLRSCKRLLDYFGSAGEATRNPRAWAAAKVYEDKARQITGGAWRQRAQTEWEGARGLDADILLWQDPRYPQRLKELPDAPPLLYCRGDMQLLQAPCVAVVGSRACSPEGVAVARDIAGRLSAAGITVVSGLAIGIDCQAHTAALRHPGRTIAVLGAGIDVAYPKSNARLLGHIASEGLILTEFMPSAPPDARNFPIRNRLISGLSLGVLIVEATRRSGSLITARCALEQNREVYAIPGPVFAELSTGCQDLVRQGARAVFSAEDILRDLAPQLRDYGGQPPAARAVFPAQAQDAPRLAGALPEDGAPSPRAPSPLAPETPEGDAGRIVRALHAKGPCHIDELARHVGIPVARLSALLVRLELQSLALRLPGMRYRAPA
ncbi:MAG: DNA-processing protein DprA [Deltaproteobacteria bacterium]|jgi:DNA processing protein|nr:DNA-processing protein DprA [Deltaproteobacteria bacterium]